MALTVASRFAPVRLSTVWRVAEGSEPRLQERAGLMSSLIRPGIPPAFWLRASWTPGDETENAVVVTRDVRGASTLHEEPARPCEQVFGVLDAWGAISELAPGFFTAERSYPAELKLWHPLALLDFDRAVEPFSSPSLERSIRTYAALERRVSAFGVPLATFNDSGLLEHSIAEVKQAAAAGAEQIVRLLEWSPSDRVCVSVRNGLPGAFVHSQEIGGYGRSHRTGITLACLLVKLGVPYRRAAWKGVKVVATENGSLELHLQWNRGRAQRALLLSGRARPSYGERRRTAARQRAQRSAAHVENP